MCGGCNGTLTRTGVICQGVATVYCRYLMGLANVWSYLRLPGPRMQLLRPALLWPYSTHVPRSGE